MPEVGRDARTVVIGVVADPDLPERLGGYLAEALPAALDAELGDGVHWRVDLLDDPFEVMYPDHELLADKARAHVRDTDWDLALCLTDLPLRGPDGVTLAEVDVAHRTALISLPALGGIRLRARLRRLVLAVVDALHTGARDADPAGLLAARLRDRGARVRAAGPGSARIVRHPGAGRARLLAGMVRANRPWQLVIGLSSALAGALTGTAFGVLYSSIWQLATALSPLRLAGITAGALTVMTVWLVAGHRLWERRWPGVRDPDRSLRNLGTLATALVGTVVFVLALFTLTVGAVLLVIPPDYLSATIGHPAGGTDYLRIALMATVLGTVAGAVGSGLEDDVTVRRATYGYREQERRERVRRLRGES